MNATAPIDYRAIASGLSFPSDAFIGGRFVPASRAVACGSDVTDTWPKDPFRATHCGETTSSRSMLRASETRELSSHET